LCGVQAAGHQSDSSKVIGMDSTLSYRLRHITFIGHTAIQLCHTGM